MSNKIFFSALVASCLAFHPGAAPPAHAMLPVGDTAHRTFYNSRDWIWESSKADTGVGDTSQHHNANAACSTQEVTFKFTPLFPIDLALGFPTRSGENLAIRFPAHPSTEGLAFAFPVRPSTEGLAFAFPVRPSTEGLAFAFPVRPSTEDLLAFAFPTESAMET
jgi:hypothetical protein